MLGFLFPPDESDPEIRRELALQGRVGLATLASIAGVLALAGLVNSFIALTAEASLIPRDAVHVALQNQTVVLTASLAILAFRRRALGLATGRAAAVGLIALFGVLIMRPEISSRFEIVPAALGFVYVLLIALTPIRPMMALALGLGLTAVYLAQARWANVALEPARGVPAFVNASVAGTILAAMLYRERRKFAEQRIRSRAHQRELERINRELHETRLQLVQSEKMASLGNLAAGIAHEINTPMGAIKANAEMTGAALQKLARALEAGDTAATQKPLAALESIRSVTLEATQRIVRIVRSLRSFARLDEADVAWTDVNACVTDTLPLLQHELKDGVELDVDLAELPKVRCHPNQINQAVMNVVLNAIQAIPGSGHVQVRTRPTEGGVQLSVRDDGVGIRPEDEPHIFDPGFTTKGVGVGTGLGLSITYRIVRAHGGTIDVETAPDHGTTMTITLPIAGPAAPP